MIIAVDFDGTCVTHEYPAIGEELPNCVVCLSRLVNNGHKLILYTMRSGKELEEAVQWFEQRGIELWGINENPEQKKWTSSPKVYAHIYIDDAALGCPTNWLMDYPESSYVNWTSVIKKLTNAGVM